MLRLPRSVGRSVMAVAPLLFVAAHWLGSGTVAAAEMERRIEAPLGRQGDPVVITGIDLGNARVQAGRFSRADAVTPFQAGDDWIGQLTIHLLNRTNLPIAFVGITLIFPETGYPPHAHRIELGRVPQHYVLDRDGKAVMLPPDVRRPLSFGPGAAMAVGLGERIDQIRSDVEPAYPLALITTFRFDVGNVYFADGMMWSVGKFVIADPDNPGGWLRKDLDYFPGDRNGNWPGLSGWPTPSRP